MTHLVVLINRLVAGSRCRILRNLILETAEKHAEQQHSEARSKGATHNTTAAPTHPLPVRRQNTSHVPHDTPTHRRSHPPTNQPTHHMLQQYRSTYSSKQMPWFVSRTPPEQAALAEKTKYCTKGKEQGHLPHTRSTHPRTKPPPPTHPPTHPPTNRPIRPPTKQPEQAALAEKTKYCTKGKEQGHLPHTRSTHPRT